MKPRDEQCHQCPHYQSYRLIMAKMEIGQRALFLVVSLTFLVRASAQLVGVDICACQPTIITFRLNFTIDCDATTVFGPGINDTACQIENRENKNVTDFVPTSVATVQILELNENREIVGDSTNDEGYFDGSEITYTSIVERAPDNITAAMFPRGFQITLTGVNAAEQSLVNILAIEYTGECGIFPLLEVGEQIGWIVFTDLGDPAEKFCPASTSSPPLVPPTIAPVNQAMTEMPSNVPSAVPPTDSEMPSDVPTVSPIRNSDEPTQSPILDETESPDDAPKATSSPACPPVDTGGKSGILNGGSGVKEEYKQGTTTENLDRFLRTGGGLECPEPILPDTPMKKDKMDVDKSPKEDVKKSMKVGGETEGPPNQKNVDDNQSGKTSKGTHSPSVSKGKGEKRGTAKPGGVSVPTSDVKGGYGKDVPATEVGSTNATRKSEVSKKSKHATEDLDEE